MHCHKQSIIVSSRFHQRDQTTHVKIINNHTIQPVATANKMAEKVGKIGDGRLTIYLCRIFLVKINKLLNEILKSIGKYSVSHKL